jgi:carbamoyl-phosphate synthase small subunit
MPDQVPALLVLEDGTRWPGYAFGAPVAVCGEVVFNTSQTGYQEILSDPSYHRQMVTLTMPQIGNTGVNAADMESDGVKAAALLCRDLSPVVSNWRAEQDLDSWLRDHGVPGITGLDTRALVLHIRRHGAMRGALGCGVNADADALLEAALAGPDMAGSDLAGEVTCDEPYEWTDGAGWWRPVGSAPDMPAKAAGLRVVAYDFGVKRSILRHLAARGCHVTVVPAGTPAAEVLAVKPDGVFLSNGPGDPAAVTYAIDAVRDLAGRLPVFGICLGHQILALALGATTYKLKFGHRGGNHPVRREDTGAVLISAHNHGFAVDADTLPASASVTHVSLNDGCCEGLAAPALRAFSVQYHPESSPGPHDSDELFDRFIDLMVTAREAGHAQA